jgi:hypothetical protein
MPGRLWPAETDQAHRPDAWQYSRAKESLARSGRPNRKVQVRGSHESAQREELLRLVEKLPETEVPAVLDDVHRHLRADKNRSWPLALFGAGQGSTPDVAAQSEDLLNDGFGHPV